MVEESVESRQSRGWGRDWDLRGGEGGSGEREPLSDMHAPVENGRYPGLRHRDRLLLHSFVNGDPIAFSHLPQREYHIRGKRHGKKNNVKHAREDDSAAL